MISTLTPAACLRRFRRDHRGNLAVVFGLVMIPVTFMMGAAIDYSRGSDLRVQLQKSTDSSTVTLCQTSSGTATAAEIQQSAQTMMTGLMRPQSVSVDTPTVTSNPRQITVTAHAASPNAFLSAAGFKTISVAATTTCASAEKTFEIALVLDNTGSMSASSGSTSKISALKTAASNFVNYVFTNPKFLAGTRVSVVPFATAVAVNPTTFRSATWIDQSGTSAYHWPNTSGAAAAGFTNRLQIFTSLKAVNANWDWAGCLETLPYPLNVQDGAPSAANKNSYYVPMLAPDEAGTGGSTTSPGGQGNANSYIDDKTTDNNCKTTPADDKSAESRACKYVHPKGAYSSANILGGTPSLGQNGPNFGCTTQPLVRLTTNQTQLQSVISAMQPAGETNIHEGLMWGWRALSPTSVLADGAAYNTANLNKVIILMTDGMNTWTSNPYNTITRSLYSALGYYVNVDGSTPNGRLPAANANPTNDTQARAAMDALTLEACTNATAAGITIYTVAFSVASDPIDKKGLDMLLACAGSKDRAFVANDSTGLISTFDKIAQGIGTTRIVR